MKQAADKKIFSVNGTEYKIIKNKDRWYLEYYVTRGFTRLRKKVYAGMNKIRNEKERIEYAIQLAYKISRGEKVSGEQVGIIKHELPAILDKYKPTFRIKTYQSKCTRVKLYCAWLDTVKVKDLDVTRDIANDFLLHMLNSGKANATVDSYMHTLSALYKKTSFNPFDNCLKVKVQSQSLKYFTPEQKKAIIDYAAGRQRILYIAIKLLYSCFIRPGEMRLLKRQDFNFYNNTIEINPQISKNGKRQHVTIPDYLVNEVRMFVEKKKDGDSYIFGNGGVPLGMNYFNNEHSKILKRLGVSGRYAFYSWKHTGVVDAVKAGINLKDIQLQLRHHSLDMVNEYLKNLGVLDSVDLRVRMPIL